MANETLTTTGYIKHHLTNLTYGLNPETGEWEFAASASEAAAMGFWSINVDSMAWSVGLGAIFLLRCYAQTIPAATLIRCHQIGQNFG